MGGHVFISHSREDQAVALRWCEALEQAGLACWMAPRDICAGTEWAAQIIEGIEGARSLLLLLGPAANRSTQVLREVERATHKRVPVVTVWLERVELAKNLEYFLSSLHWIGLDGSGFEEQVAQVVRALKSVVRPAAAPDAPATNSTQLAASREMLQALEWELAQHVGPVARALVQRAAQRAHGPVQLIELLAADIDDAAGRAEFVAAARTLARRLTS
jgi:TIR domain-containing protein